MDRCPLRCLCHTIKNVQCLSSPPSLIAATSHVQRSSEHFDARIVAARSRRCCKWLFMDPYLWVRIL